MVTIPAIEYSQGEKTIYLGTIGAKDLVDIYEVDLWSKDNPRGYQRPWKATRSRRFRNFLSDFNGVFHQTVLLNARDGVGKLIFEPLKGNAGMLTIDGKVNIVDGQHRVGGLKLLLETPRETERFSRFPVPALIFKNLARPEEALQFYVANKTQEGVRADLSDRLLVEVIGEVTDDFRLKVLGTREKRDVTAEAVELSDALNENAASIWYEKMALPDVTRMTPNLAISQRSMTQSLKLILTSDITQALFDNPPDDLEDPLIDYWSAIGELCPKATGADFNDFEILKTKGAFVLHSIFPKVALEWRRDKTRERFVEILQKVANLNDDAWSRAGVIGRKGTGQKVFKEISDEFLRDIVAA